MVLVALSQVDLLFDFVCSCDHIQSFFTQPSLQPRRAVIIGAMRDAYGL